MAGLSLPFLWRACSGVCCDGCPFIFLTATLPSIRGDLGRKSSIGATKQTIVVMALAFLHGVAAILPGMGGCS